MESWGTKKKTEECRRKSWGRCVVPEDILFPNSNLKFAIEKQNTLDGWCKIFAKNWNKPNDGFCGCHLSESKIH